MFRRRILPLALVIVCLPVAATAAGEDWPQWKHNAHHDATCPNPMPDAMALLWSREMPRPEPAWPITQWKLHFDKSYEPIVKDGLLFVGSMVTDSLTAFDAATGEEKWRFYAEGPIRFAPCAYKDKVFFVSDDGFLYCLAAKTGKLAWKRRGGPDNRRGLGNGRLGSLWVARGAPVIRGDRLYFAAGIWPFMGCFVYCIHADTGNVIWCNSGEGAKWRNQPHGGAVSFGGIAPQGYIAATKDYLIVPNGRSLPGIFNIENGSFLGGQTQVKMDGGTDVTYVIGGFYVRGRRYNLPSGSRGHGEGGFLTPHTESFKLSGDTSELIGQKHRWVKKKDRRGRLRDTSQWYDVWRGKINPMLKRIHIRTASHVFGHGDKNSVIGVKLGKEAKDKVAPVKVTFSATVDGPVWRMLAAERKLFVVTEKGTLYAFGTGRGKPKSHEVKVVKPQRVKDRWTDRAAELLEIAGTKDGYCVSLGAGSGRLIDEIVAQSFMDVIVVEPDAKKADALRRRLDARGAYGSRAMVLVGNPFDYELPPYLATLIVSEDLTAAGFIPNRAQVDKLVRVLRPYGGVAVLPPAREQNSLVKWAEDGLPRGVQMDRVDVILRRRGPLPGSAPWTHEHANPANTVANRDDRVKLPLGLLWFGGSSHLDVLPRHGHGPTPLIAGGRLFIQGLSSLSARDVYTGRTIWKRKFGKNYKTFGMYWDKSFDPDIYAGHYNQRHIPGANLFGSNYCTTEDAVYLIQGPELWLLDAATGETKKTFTAPKTKVAENPNWGFVAWQGDLLITATEPIRIATSGDASAGADSLPENAQPLIAQKAEWQYHLGTAPANWATPAFDAKKWPTGAAGFGYGDGDDATKLDAMRGKHRTVCIRRTFDVADPKSVRMLVLLARYDDAFIAYLNGTEVARSPNIRGTGPRADVRRHEAGKTFERFDIRNVDGLRKGTNVLALVGYNTQPGSSDLTLDPYLVGVTGQPPRSFDLRGAKGVHVNAPFSWSSKELVVLDRKTGEVKWTRRAKISYRHNAIVVADGKIFVLDSAIEQRLSHLRRIGLPVPKPAVLALDLETGKELWRHEQHVFGTWLGYSPKHDVLIQCGSYSRDRGWDEVRKGMIAFRGKTGKVLWKDLGRDHAGPIILWGDLFFTNWGWGGQPFDIRSGQRKPRIHPLTGKPTDWSWNRFYGCNTAVASTHLMTFRSGAAGFFDLDTMGGTGNFGGFKSGCTSNLIPADGVLNAPDYTRTCTCGYPNQTSLALVHMPDVEVWTHTQDPSPGGEPVVRMGINLGAPGDRLHNGTLWVDVPNEGSPSPGVGVAMGPSKQHVWKDKHGRTHRRGVFAGVVFRQHSSRLQGGPLRWVGASCAEGIETLVLSLIPDGKPERRYTVRLVFCDPYEGYKPGDRVFNITLQGRVLKPGFDVVKQAGGPQRVTVAEFKGIPVKDKLTIGLAPRKGKPILSGVEVIAE
jgi:outer membrane protein assembly factor BamB